MLASGSPRRSELLGRLGVELEIQPPRGEEPRPIPGEEPGHYAKRVAAGKAREVFDPERGALCLAADTVVAGGGAILGKPRSLGEARSMLAALSGRPHRVVTGMTLWDPTGRVGPAEGWFRDSDEGGAAVWSAAEETRVYFRTLGSEEIDAYLAVDESMDKAGAYAIQSVGIALLEKVDGCYSNVVGLPLARLIALLASVRVDTSGAHR